MMSSEEEIVLLDSSSDEEYVDSENPTERTSITRRKRKLRTSTSESPLDLFASNNNILEILSDTDDENNNYLNLSLRQRIKKRTRRSKRILGEIKTNERITMYSSEEEEKKEEEKLHYSIGISGKQTKSRKEAGCPASKHSASVSSSATAYSEKENKAVAEEYLRLLRNNLKKRTFPLSQVSQTETISTGRTIKPLKAWSGHWPALREFLQNTVDHLHLIDSKTGRRKSCVTLEVTKLSQGSALAKFEFKCQNSLICKMTASQDELLIEQNYTFPIASRALDTGVPDTTKCSNASNLNQNNQAGGFGDGFKTASVALIANSKMNDFKKLEWQFLAHKEGKKITWKFDGLTKESVATFAKCKVLQVEIKKENLSVDEFKNDNPTLDKAESDGSDYIMKQIIQVKNIGKSFLEEAVPRFIVFWDLDESQMISSSTSSRKVGGDFICPVSGQPPILDAIRPLSGVYVRGIWVRQSKIKDTIMCFFGNRLEVTGRDRNEVYEEMLIEAIIYVLHSCRDKAYLRQLLEPLRGQRDDIQKKTNSKTSWLLNSPRFFNQVIEQDKDYILHNIFNIPRDSIFVSRKTTQSKDPFISWASSFLAENDVALVPIDNNANRHLFVEVNEYEISSLCVKILMKRNRSAKTSKTANSIIFRKLFTFMGFGKAKALFISDLKMAFVHESHIFVPDTDTTRDLVVKVLNICNSRLESADSESYSSLMQSIFENLSNSCTVTTEDIEKILKRAKEIKKENRNFVCRPVGSTTEKAQRDLQAIQSKSAKRGERNKKEIQERSEPYHNDIGNSRPTTYSDLLQQIDSVAKRANRMNRGNDGRNRIIPSVDFESDNAGDESCLRPASSLKNTAVHESMGGGSMYLNSSTNCIDEENKTKIRMIRNLIDDAIKIVEKSIPTLKPLLQRVSHGYDSGNDTYEAFCDGTNIIVNIFSYIPKCKTNTSSRDLLHDLVITITHELAHFLEPRAGHGPKWRDTHMKMLVQVMLELEKKCE